MRKTVPDVRQPRDRYRPPSLPRRHRRRRLCRPTWAIAVWLAVGLALVHAQPPARSDVAWPPPPRLSGPAGGDLPLLGVATGHQYVSLTDPRPPEQADQDNSSEGMAARLEKLERDYQSLLEGQDKWRASQQKAVLLGLDDVTLQIAGRIHIDYWAFPGDSPGVNAFETGDPADSPQDRIEIRRARIQFSGDVFTTMLYKFDIEFSDPNDPEIRDLYFGWHDLPVLQELRLGNQKRPYSLDQLNSSNDNVFLERPFIGDAFDDDSRRFGITSRGVSRSETWNWQYGVFNLAPIQDTGRYISDHAQLEIAGRLAHTGWYDACAGGRRYTHFGIAGLFAHPDGSAAASAQQGSNQAIFQTRPEARSSSTWLDTQEIVGARDFGLLGLEGVINSGPCQLVGEYQHLWLSRDAGYPGPLQFHGGYVYLSYFLTGEYIPWNPRLGVIGRVKPNENFFLVDDGGGVRAGWGAWQIAVRGSYADLTDGNVAGGVGESVTFGLNWYWNAYARMQFNYLCGNIDQHFPVAGQTFGSYQILGTRFMIVF